MEPRFFATPAEFREWLAENHAKETELVVGFHKKSTGKPSITWPEAVDQALCFGWIDGVRRSIDADSYSNRFTPRKKRSNWSAVNIKRVEELTALGLMHPAGLSAFAGHGDPLANAYSYENRERGLDEALEARFRQNEQAWAFFQAQPPSYRKTSSWWVMSAKREATRESRLDKLIEFSAAGQRMTDYWRNGKKEATDE